jgi:hypothetical protein
MYDGYYYYFNKMTNHYIATLVYLPSQRFQANYVMLPLLRHKTPQQCEGIYDIRFSYHDTEGLLTSHHICGYLKGYLVYRGHVLTTEVPYTQSQLP